MNGREDGSRPGGGRISRREFLAGAATPGATGALLKSSRVVGTEANSRVEVGCVGLGGRGSLIAGMLAKHKGYQVTGVADYFPQVAESAGERLKVAKGRRFSGLSGYRKLIESKVDAVFLETPPCFFPEHAARAVEAGCHVYVAKPVAVDVPGCLTIAGLGKKATKAKQVFLVDFQTRTHPHFIESIRRVHDGALGKVDVIWSIYTDNGFRDPAPTKTIETRLRHLIWTNDVAIGGGMFVNAGIHAADVALWVAGKLPVSAMGCSRRTRPNPHGDTQDAYSLTYQLPDGPIWSHRGEHVPNVHGFVCGCQAFGAGGHFQGNYVGTTYLRGGKKPYRGGDVQGLYESGIGVNLDTFHKSITEGVYHNPTVEPSVNANLACILGRDAGLRNGLLTWGEMIEANRRIEVDLTGLKA